jgi:hypothetical protein
MLYRAIRAITELYPLAVFGLYLAAFFVAFAFTVLYPIVPLFLLILAIFGVVFFRVVYLGLQAMERWAARRWTRTGRCPACHAALERFAVPAAESTGGGATEPIGECVRCQRIHREDGSVWSPDHAESDRIESMTDEAPGSAGPGFAGDRSTQALG